MYNSPEPYDSFLVSIEISALEDVLKILRKNPNLYPFPSLKPIGDFERTLLGKSKGKYQVSRDMRQLGEVLDYAYSCVNCGKCLESCLSYDSTGDPRYSPVGRFNRLLEGNTSFEYCFGCIDCSKLCPVSIPISKMMETLPSLSQKKYVQPIDVGKKSKEVQDLERKLEEKYRNRAPFILFAGCSIKYDPLGLKGFLHFLLENGDSISFSPRVKIMDSTCCGFDKYIGGDIEGAQSDVNKILEMMRSQNAQGVYFLCPEGLYVFNKLSGGEGVLAYDLIKNRLEGDIHVGCWMEKLGKGKKNEGCAGSYVTVYQGSVVKPSRISGNPICPFASWKTGKPSVYSFFNKREAIVEGETSTEEVANFDFASILKEVLVDSAMESADYLAEKINNWELGGPNFYKNLISPYIRKVLFNKLKQKLSEEKYSKILKSASLDNPILNAQIDKAVQEVSASDWKDLALRVREKMLTSNKLDYIYQDKVSSEEFVNVMKEVISKTVTKKIVSEALNDVYFSAKK